MRGFYIIMQAGLKGLNYNEVPISEEKNTGLPVQIDHTYTNSWKLPFQYITFIHTSIT